MYSSPSIHLIIISIINGVAESIFCGNEASITNYKYMASITRMNRRHECGGAIIDENHILTAAHCMENRKKNQIYVTVGTDSVGAMDPHAQIRYIKKIQTHPQYYSGIDNPSVIYEWFVRQFQCFSGHPESVKQPANDIAVLTLDSPLIFNDAVGKVSLPSHNFATQCTSCVFAGWGYINNAGTDNRLYWTPMSILPAIMCKVMETPPRDNEFCAIDANRRSCSLEGDSGGPLVCNGVIVGVLSRGGCDPKIPIIFTNVYEHLDSFIKPALEN